MSKPGGGLRIGWGEIVFSLKTFFASMLALWIAFSLGFSKPYWAMATVYIVSQPLSGAVTLKAVYRVFGTFLGAAVTLVLVPNLVNAPGLLCVGVSAWVGICLFISLLDRTPRSYFFMLAGYTAAIIGFTSVNDPRTLFDTALSRVEEISLGILCASVVSRVVFPRHAGPVLLARIETWLWDAGKWAEDVLSGRSEEEGSRADAQRMAADTVGLVALIAYLPYDTSGFKHTREQLVLLEQEMTALIPILSSIGDRITALQQGSKELPLGSLLAQISNWISSGREGGEADAEKLRSEIRRIEVAADWRGLLEFNLCARLQELVDVWEICWVLRNEIATGARLGSRTLKAANHFDGEPVLHRDTARAWSSSLTAIVAILICCAFWIGTGWNEGGVAAQLTAALSCIFCNLDHPVPAHRTHTAALICSVGIAGIYQFLILPHVDGLPLLILVLSPFLLLCGALMPTPRFGFSSFALCVNTSLYLGLESSLNLDFESFVNSNLAAIVAAIIAIVVSSLLLAISAEDGVARILHALWSDIAQLAGPGGLQDSRAIARRMVDQLGLLVPRLVALPEDSPFHASDALTDMRVALNVADMQRARCGLFNQENQTLGGLMTGLSAHFRAKLSDAQAEPGKALLAEIDVGLERFTDPVLRGESGTAFLHGLVGIRRCLFPEADPFEPGPLEPKMRSLS